MQKLGLIFTGGTIGSTTPVRDGDDQLVALPAKDPPDEQVILKAMPRHLHPAVEVERPIALLSEDIVPSDWEKIEASVRRLVRRGCDALLIFHGTDTMGFTSAALTFCLAGIEIPVVLTGSNLPPGQPGSDAIQNVRDSIVALESLPPGVFVAFAGRPGGITRIHDGASVRKTRGSGVSFRSINRLPLAMVRGLQLEWNRKPVGNLQTKAVAKSRFDERVFWVRLFPGLDLDKLADSLIGQDFKGVVIELYGSATGSSRSPQYALERFVKRCIDRDVVVVAALARQPVGKANVYKSTVALRDAGVEIVSMIPETALVKLMWALGSTGGDPEQVRLLMKTNVAGEMSHV